MTVRGRRIQLLRDKIASKDMLVNQEEEGEGEGDDNVNDGHDVDDDEFGKDDFILEIISIGITMRQHHSGGGDHDISEDG